MFSELKTDTSDLSIDFYGYEDCAPSYSFGPAIREHFVIHYISKGKGKFFYNNQEISLAAGDLFLLKPNEVTYYQANQDEPWSYYWIGMSGNKASDYFNLSNLGIKAYLFNKGDLDTKTIANQIIQLITKAETRIETTNKHLELLGLTYKLLFEISSLSPNKTVKQLSQAEKICLECRHIIEKHYNLDGLSISSIADELNVNRSYLTTLFKKYHHLSPKEYLLHTRMKRAKQLLENTAEPIKVISYSVGYLDPLYFSKVFRDFYKMSPSQCRKNPSLSTSD